MNIKARIASLSSAAVLSLALAAAPAMAEHEYATYRRSDAIYDYAHVISSEPIIRYVTVRTPVQECWNDTEYYSVAQRPRGTAGGTIIGAIIGGVIAAALMIGAAIGAHLAHAVSQATLRRVVAWVLVAVGIFIVGRIFLT